ncbi:hypothetical protein MYK68_18570 [Gordonia sp. PP30]|uniref:hypothetical protein n=1 Tax=Gordonia sp. PP30 TaxID=2935861 RepID=UPI001FFEEFDB|nr:hypothetical protein [Gordonia sp. PP30]UQE74689.1 hypothetical protein MYK68_18570 [Gordonia sp. PP30]
MMNPMIDDPLDALADVFTGTPAERLTLAAEVADRLDRLRSVIDAGEIDATAAQRAALDGAVIALRAVVG